MRGAREQNRAQLRKTGNIHVVNLYFDFLEQVSNSIKEAGTVQRRSPCVGYFEYPKTNVLAQG